MLCKDGGHNEKLECWYTGKLKST